MTDGTLFLGTIFTGRRRVAAALVEDGRVIAAGPEATVRRSVPTGAERVDLGTGIAVPGLADAHLHLGELARSRSAFPAGRARSVRELQQQLAAWSSARDLPAIIGEGFSADDLAERRWPTSRELDEAVRDRPVVLVHASGHAAVLNSRARDRAFGSRDAPPGALATGVVLEEALDAVRPIVEEGTPLTPASVESVVGELLGYGLTAVGTMNAGPAELRVLEGLAGAGRLAIRVRAYPPADGPREPYRRLVGRAGPLAVVGVKAFADGAFGPRTAALEEPYADEPATCGVDRTEGAELADVLRRAREQGLAPAVHAIGDRGVRRAAALLAGLPSGAPPSRIEHASLVPPPLFDALRQAGAVLAVQPGFLLTDTWLAARLGPRRVRWAYPFRSLIDAGLALAGSSDAPYDDPDPWNAMRAAVLRRDPYGRSANPRNDQSLTGPEALSLYSAAAHGALGEPAGGSLEPGATADLVVLAAPEVDRAIRDGGCPVRAVWLAGSRVVGPAEPRPS